MDQTLSVMGLAVKIGLEELLNFFCITSYSIVVCVLENTVTPKEHCPQ